MASLGTWTFTSGCIRFHFRGRGAGNCQPDHHVTCECRASNTNSNKALTSGNCCEGLDFQQFALPPPAQFNSMSTPQLFSGKQWGCTKEASGILDCEESFRTSRAPKSKHQTMSHSGHVRQNEQLMRVTAPGQPLSSQAHACYRR